MSRLVFPVGGVRTLEAANAFPEQPWTLRGQDWAKFLVEYRATINGGSAGQLRAPSVGFFQIVLTSDPPMLVFRPTEAGSWIGHFGGWRAPVPTALTFSFENLDEPAIQTEIVSRNYHRLVGIAHKGRPKFTLEMADRETEAALAEWRRDEFARAGPLLRQGDVIHSLAGSNPTVRLGMGHVQELRPGDGQTINRWYWFDLHEYLHRLIEANAFEPPFPKLTPSPQGITRSSTQSFRIWYDTQRNDPEPALKSLSGGLRDTTVFVPSSSGLPIIPAQLQYLSDNAPLVATAFGTPDQWTYRLDYQVDPRRGVPGSPEDPERLSQQSDELELSMATFPFDFTKARTPTGPVGVRLLADGNGPTVLAYKDPIGVAESRAKQVLGIHAEIERKLREPDRNAGNAAKLLLAETVRDIVRNNPGTSDPTGNDAFITWYFTQIERLRRQTEVLGETVTEQLFGDLQANPTAGRARAVETVIEALLLTGDGEKILRSKFAGFVDPDRAGAPVVTPAELAGLWNNHRSLRPAVATIFSHAARVDLYYTVKGSGSSETALRRYREHLATALDSFDGVILADTTLPVGGRRRPWFEIQIDTAAGTKSTGLDLETLTKLELSVVKLLVPFKLVSSSLNVYLSTKALIDDPSPKTIVTFAKDLSKLLDEGATITESRALTKPADVLKLAQPIFTTCSIGSMLTDISEKARAGDDETTAWLSLALAATAVAAFVPVAAPAAGILALTFKLISKSTQRTDIELLLAHTAFGADHEGSPWENNVPLQIATLNGVRYPFRDTSFTEDERVGGSVLRLQFSPVVGQVGSLVTFDLWKGSDFREWDALKIGPVEGSGRMLGGQFVVEDTNSRFEDAGLGRYSTTQSEDGHLQIEIVVPIPPGPNVVSRVDRATITVTNSDDPLPRTDRLSLRQRVATQYGYATRTVIEKQ